MLSVVTTSTQLIGRPLLFSLGGRSTEWCVCRCNVEKRSGCIFPGHLLRGQEPKSLCRYDTSLVLFASVYLFLAVLAAVVYSVYTTTWMPSGR